MMIQKEEGPRDLIKVTSETDHARKGTEIAETSLVIKSSHQSEKMNLCCEHCKIMGYIKDKC